MLCFQAKTLCVGMAIAALLSTTGCNVESGRHGEKNNVDISTPFGGLRVRTNDGAVLESIGLAAYPGAVPVKKNKDDGSADVDIHFGNFQLRVKSASYRTGDPLDKVETFYRNDLRRYGDVIACHGNKPAGQPTRTIAGLTCEDNSHRHISVDDSERKDALQLRAGSRDHQHIVGLEPDQGGTQFALVMLDLPAGAVDDSK